MKKIAFVCLCLGVFAAMTSSAFAFDFGANITILDTVKCGTGWYGAQEDQEVEPGMTTGQCWDLEGFYLNGTTLTMIGGYDFVDGYDGVQSGDIFLDVNGDLKYGSANDHSGHNNDIKKNTANYDYVLHFDMKDETYSVYSLTAKSYVYSIGIDANEESNPWKYKKNGTLLESYEDIPFSFVENLKSSDVYGLLGKKHYALSVDLSFLESGTEFTSHYTMQCGNDNLMGHGMLAPVPEPASMLLVGTGLLGVFGLRRKK